jgi:hypothetical protein
MDRLRSNLMVSQLKIRMQIIEANLSTEMNLKRNKRITLKNCTYEIYFHLID